MEPRLVAAGDVVPPGIALELRRSARTHGVLEDSPDLEQLIRPDPGRRLLCRSCGEPITADEHRIEIAGGHVHRRTNPVGIEFEFGCFEAAPGAIAVGETTTEFSWFPGYAWVYSICFRCGAHLGWLFEGGDPPFHGLILNRLEEEKPASPEA